jgi:hypothetical protein
MKQLREKPEMNVRTRRLDATSCTESYLEIAKNAQIFFFT